MVILHVAGNGAEPEKWLAAHPLEGAEVHRKGEPAVAGRRYSLSGFKVDLGSVNSKAELEELVASHVREHSTLYSAVAREGGDVSLRIGLMVPPMEPRTVSFAPRTLAELASCGVAIHVTGYPCMEDEESAQEDAPKEVDRVSWAQRGPAA